MAEIAYKTAKVIAILATLSKSMPGIVPIFVGVIPSVIVLVISLSLSGPITVMTAEIIAPKIARTNGIWKPLI